MSGISDITISTDKGTSAQRKTILGYMTLTANFKNDYLLNMAPIVPDVTDELKSGGE